MIELTHVNKHFDDIVAVNDVSVKIKEGCVFGLIGTNGAGKSTIMRMITGVLKPDGGEILIDGKEVYDSVESKKLFFFIPDEPYFRPAESAEMFSGPFEIPEDTLLIPCLPGIPLHGYKNTPPPTEFRHGFFRH